MTRVQADPASCIGSGQCALRAPEVFDQSDDGVVVLVDSAPPEELDDAVHEAALRCPVQAISIEEN